MSRLLIINFIFLIPFLYSQSNPNPPRNLKASCCNNYVLVEWDEPLPGASYDTYIIYVNTGFLTSIPASQGTSFRDNNSGLHTKRTYTIKASHSEWGTVSIASNSSDGYGIRCFYVSMDGGSSPQTGEDPDHSVQLSNINNNGFLNYPFQTGGNGFYRGDTVFLVGTFSDQISFPTSPSFPQIISGIVDKQFVLCGAQLYHGANYQATLSGNGNGNALNSSGADYISFAHLRFTNINQYSSAIVFDRTSNGSINNCYFDFNSGSQCIKMQTDNNDCVNNIIEKNIVYQGTGADCWGSLPPIPPEPAKPGNGDFIQMGRQGDGNSGSFSGHIIRHNDVTLQNSSGVLLAPHTDCVQIYRTSKEDYIVIHNNIFRWKGSRTDGNTQGIFATSLLSNNPGGVIEIYNNIFYMATTGKNMCAANNYIQTQIIPPAFHTSYIVLKIWNNTFYAKSNWNMNINYGEKIVWVDRVPTEEEPIPSGSQSFELINNIFANFTSPQSLKKLSVLALNNFEGVQSEISNSAINDNLYFCPSFGRGDYITYYKDGIQDYTFDEFKAATLHEVDGHGGTSSIYDPAFPTITDNPVSFLAGGTYVVDYATTLNSLFTSYFSGYNRVANQWDRGAWEYTPLPPPDEEGRPGAGKIVASQLIIPTEFKVSKNYPNPFNPTSSIDFVLPQDGLVQIKLFSITGKEILNCLEFRSVGSHTYTFDLRGLPSGVYFYSLLFDGHVFNNKMMLLK